MRAFLYILPLFYVFSADTLCAESKPNVIIILADDLGYGDLKCFNKRTKNTTPRLDRMAAEGMRFSSFYTSGSNCSPTRASILTGCYHVRLGINHVFWPFSKTGLKPSEFTLAEALKSHDYQTAAVGKWHLGDLPEYLPTRQGFDSYFGIPYSHDMVSLRKAEQSEKNGHLFPLPKTTLPLYRNESVSEKTKDISTITERYTKEVENLIDQFSQNSESPFFIYFAHHAVHLPLSPGKSYLGKSDNEEYGDWLLELDNSTGRILDKLKSLELDTNTIVLFLSDNGPTRHSRGSTGPFSGHKGTSWEGGHRVPLIVHWPGKIPQGKVSNDIIASIDIMPSLLGLLEPETDLPLPIDGLDLSSSFFDNNEATPVTKREQFAYFKNGSVSALRQGEWKLKIEKIKKKQPRYLLFNLATDPAEKNDVSDLNLKRVTEFKKAVADLRTQFGTEKSPGPAVRK